MTLINFFPSFHHRHLSASALANNEFLILATNYVNMKLIAIIFTSISAIFYYIKVKSLGVEVGRHGKKLFSSVLKPSTWFNFNCDWKCAHSYVRALRGMEYNAVSLVLKKLVLMRKKVVSKPFSMTFLIWTRVPAFDLEEFQVKKYKPKYSINCLIHCEHHGIQTSLYVS